MLIINFIINKMNLIFNLYLSRSISQRIIIELLNKLYCYFYSIY